MNCHSQVNPEVLLQLAAATHAQPLTPPHVWSQTEAMTSCHEIIGSPQTHIQLPVWLQTDAAVASYQEAIHLQPGFAEAHCNLGVLHKAAGRLQEALECYEAALRANPSFELVHQNLAIAYTERGTQLKDAGQTDEGAACLRST